MIKKVRIKNFKAIKDSGPLKLDLINCFIGNNGAGKSSLLEALLTFKEFVTDDLDKAMERWKGFENIQYKGTTRKIVQHQDLLGDNSVEAYDHGVSFSVHCQNGPKQSKKKYHAESIITQTGENEELLILSETFESEGSKSYVYDRDFTGQMSYSDESKAAYTLDTPFWRIPSQRSMLSNTDLPHDIRDWQFLRLNPDRMGEPITPKRTSGPVHLETDGSNIAEYLWSIKQLDASAFESILDTMVSSVLPYASDLQAEELSRLDRKIYLSLTEADYKIPGWLLSTGTLRIVALLAVFRHPSPPPVVIIEELENGLDPRTIHLIMEEIRYFTQETGSQVIFTTHSPYLLDLMKLDEIIFVDKEDRNVRFYRPKDNEGIDLWAEKYKTGALYTMSRLNRYKK